MILIQPISGSGNSKPRFLTISAYKPAVRAKIDVLKKNAPHAVVDRHAGLAGLDCQGERFRCAQERVGQQQYRNTSDNLADIFHGLFGLAHNAAAEKSAGEIARLRLQFHGDLLFALASVRQGIGYVASQNFPGWLCSNFCEAIFTPSTRMSKLRSPLSSPHQVQTSSLVAAESTFIS